MLRRLLAYDAWATATLLGACASLSAEQLATKPDARSDWSVGYTLWHVVWAQAGYASMLSGDPREPVAEDASIDELRRSADRSGAQLLAWAESVTEADEDARFTTSDGYEVTRWVVLLQALQHAIDHRRQICGFLRALDVEAPSLDGWSYGESVGAVVPPDEE